MMNRTDLYRILSERYNIPESGTVVFMFNKDWLHWSDDREANLKWLSASMAYASQYLRVAGTMTLRNLKDLLGAPLGMRDAKENLIGFTCSNRDRIEWTVLPTSKDCSDAIIVFSVTTDGIILDEISEVAKKKYRRKKKSSKPKAERTNVTEGGN